MDKVFKSIFEGVRNDLQSTLQAYKSNTINDSTKPVSLKSSGTQEIDFDLDANGNYHYEIEQYGAGVTINISCTINSPDAIFSATVNSSDGGGGHWDNITIGQAVICNISTSFWHKTKVTVDIHSSIPSTHGHATIIYSY
ncbi:hypothetical protein SH1V18_40430 [Vallitalea longa]|uniref:Uncharacterized protein n=1 Tax=Vallitalea longa TaxID=2936439 RepID=A0A9W6DHK7_9FIRM|nr:hypothetical protein [Vallitalea longa]GKX31563.1 hypothetical protein SH1V18_40430 [Vallitalea longa]